MLQQIREYAQGFIAWIIIGAIILSFALWGINSYFQDDSAGFQVAVVNGEDVSRYEYQIAYQNERARMEQMFGEKMDLDAFDQQIKSSALDRVVDNTLLMQIAREHGYSVSDEQVAKTIQSIGAFQEEGKFSRAAYERQLKNSGEPTAAFEARIRRAMLADQMIRGIANTGFVTEGFVASSQKLQEQERELAYLVIKVDDFKKDVKIDDNRVEDYYKINSEQFKTPEMVDLDYVELTADDMMASISVTEDELKEYFDDNKSRFQSPEERKARHILIEGKTDDAKKKAQDIYQQIKNGGDFAELAKKNSQDPGSASQGGLLDFFGRGVMDKAFEEQAFKLNKGEVSEPVLSQFGYHIIKLEDVRGGNGKSFNDVRVEIEKAVKQQKADKLFFEKADKLSNLAFETPDTLDEIVKELGLSVKSTGWLGRGAPGVGIAKDQKVVAAAFSDEVLKDGLNSKAIEIGKNHIVVVRRKDHKPAQVRPLAEVRATIVNTLTTDDARQLAKKRGEELLAKAVESGDLKKLAQEGKYAFTEKAWFKRTDSKANNEVLSSAFTAPKPADNKVNYKGASLANGDYAVIALSGVKDGDVATLPPADMKRLRENMSVSAGVDQFSMLLKSLKDKAEIKKFEASLDQ